MANPQKAKKILDDYWRSRIAGLFGGITGAVGCHPFDTVKCRIQAQTVGNIVLQYSNTRDAFISIYKKEGVRGLYKGLVPHAVMQRDLNIVIFSVEHFVANNICSKENSCISRHFKAGMAAGFIQSFVCAPLELVKLHTQHQKIGEVGRYQGNLEALKKIWHKQGMRGCCHGLTVTMVRDVSGFGVYFAAYEGLMNALAEKQGISREGVGVTYAFIFGGTAGVASWACNYPVDLAKTGFQLDGVNGTERQYRNSWDVIIKAWKKGGLRSLFRGFVPTMVRAFTFNMFTFPTVELVKKYHP